jgi:molybdopterin converting factor small subunit
MDLEGMFAMMFGEQNEERANQQAAYEEQQAQLLADAERAQAMSDIDSLFGSKLDAAERSATEINGEVAIEQDNALMHGLDYSLSEEDKIARVNNRFAEYWSEGDESTLGNLLGQYSPQGYTWDSPVMRGTADGSTNKKAPPEKKVGGRVRSTKSGSSSTVLTEDELGGNTTALGV